MSKMCLFRLKNLNITYKSSRTRLHNLRGKLGIYRGEDIYARASYLVYNERTTWNEISRAQRVRLDHAVVHRRQVDNIFSCYETTLPLSNKTKRRARARARMHTQSALQALAIGTYARLRYRVIICCY